MSRRKKDSLRPLTDVEQLALTQLSRSQAAPAVQVARATMILAVAAGSDHQRAARSAGRRSGDAVSHLVARFNLEGLPATAAANRGSTIWPPANASSARSGESPRPRPTAQPPGRSRP